MGDNFLFLFFIQFSIFFNLKTILMQYYFVFRFKIK